MKASLGGDAAAHRLLLDRLSRHLRAYYKGRLARIGRSATEAEDLMQERAPISGVENYGCARNDRQYRHARQVGCMVATSLAVAPALLLAGRAAFVDLDGPLLLANDRPDGLRYEGARVFPPEPALWG